MFWNLPPFRYDAWSEWPSELEDFVSFFLGLLSGNVDEFMNRPGFFEAVLVAEVAGFEIHGFAGGTHHGCLFAAARGPAHEVAALHS